MMRILKTNRIFILSLAITCSCSNVSKNSILGADTSIRPSRDITSSGICSFSHSGTAPELGSATVEICDQFYDHAPLVHLPAGDEVSDAKNVSFYGAIDTLLPTATFISDRLGQKWVVLDKNGALPSTYDYSAFPSGMNMPSNIYLYVIYRFQGRAAPVPDRESSRAQKGIILTKADPIIYIPGNLFDTYFLGRWEGLVTQRISPAPPSPSGVANLFDPRSTQPIRVNFTALRPLPEPLAEAVLQVWPDSQHQGQILKGITEQDAIGTIQNFENSVLGSDGKCMKSLSSLGTHNPFLGATNGDIDFYRYPGMHGAGSEAVVMTFPLGTTGLSPNGMSVPFFMKASTLILSQPNFEATELPHGLHFGFKISGFHKVNSADRPCPAD